MAAVQNVELEASERRTHKPTGDVTLGRCLDSELRSVCVFVYESRLLLLIFITEDENMWKKNKLLF